MWRWLLALTWTLLHWTLAVQAQLVRKRYVEEEEELEEVDYVTLDDGTVVEAGGAGDAQRSAGLEPTLSPDDKNGLDHGGEEAKEFTGWMWISAFSILAFGGAGLIFMVAREAVKFCRRCQEREAGIERAQSINALNSHRTQDGGHLSTPGSPMGPRVFAPNIVLSAFSGPHR